MRRENKKEIENMIELLRFLFSEVTLSDSNANCEQVVESGKNGRREQEQQQDYS